MSEYLPEPKSLAGRVKVELEVELCKKKSRFKKCSMR